MTIPACAAHRSSPCPVGCYDDIHVRALAVELAEALRRFLTAGDRWHNAFDWLQRQAYDYAEAIRDPRSERAWPILSFDGKHPCDPGGWCANVSNEEMADLYYAIRGPVVTQMKQLPGGVVRVEEIASYRLPAHKVRLGT